jgi:hypothetical protein
MATFQGQWAGDAFAHEAITVSTNSIGGTAATYNPSGARGAKCAIISTETSPIRFRLDGSAPTSTTGHYVAAGTMFTIYGGAQVAGLRMIRDTTAGSDATVRVSYLR